MSKKEFARGFLKNKDQLLQDMGRSDSISRKRKLEGRHGELQEAVYLWVVEKIARELYRPMHLSILIY